MKSSVKFILFSLFSFLVLVIIYFAINYFAPINPDRLNFVHAYLAKGVYESFEKTMSSYPDNERALVDIRVLLAELEGNERTFADNILNTPPKNLGVKTPFYSKQNAYNLVRIDNVKLKNNEETGIQYLPSHVYEDYDRMMAAMESDLGRKLYVDSGYRSAGRQAYLFFKYLVTVYGYSLTENCKWIAMPGYSEHGSPENTAIDFISGDGINGFSGSQTAADFERLDEFRWLRSNAAKYNFVMSYPYKNQAGINYEPWHWHWEKKVTENQQTGS